MRRKWSIAGEDPATEDDRKLEVPPLNIAVSSFREVQLSCRKWMYYERAAATPCGHLIRERRLNKGRALFLLSVGQEAIRCVRRLVFDEHPISTRRG